MSVQKFPVFLKQFKLLAWQLFRFAGLLYQTIFKQCSISIPFENFRFFYVFRGFRCGRLIKNGFTSSKKKENKPKKINSSRASRIIIQLLQISQNYVEIQLLQSISKCEMQSKLQAVTPNNAIETHDSWVFSLKIVSKRFIRNIKVTSWQPNIFFLPSWKIYSRFCTLANSMFLVARYFMNTLINICNLVWIYPFISMFFIVLRQLSPENVKNQRSGK